VVDRALAALDGAFLSDDGRTEDDAHAVVVPPDLDALGRAMTLHAAVVERAAGDDAAARLHPSDLRAAAHAWDEALDGDAVARALEGRAAAIGGGDPRAAIARLREDVDADLLDVTLRARVPLALLAGGGGTTTRVRAAARDRLLRDFEAASEALRRRTDERRALPGPDEWREFDALVRLHARGVAAAGDEFRKLAFYTLNLDATHLAVWLHNERKEVALANAVFRFCLTEAEAVGDEAATALQRKNVQCGF
jgi:hypothetical protein